MMRPSDLASANRRRALIGRGPVIADELVACHERPPRGDIDGHKLVVTFAGAFEFQVGRSATWIDGNRLLFAYPGESYVDRHLISDTGHSSVILTPDAATADELWQGGAVGRATACPLTVQAMVQLLRRTNDPLQAQELGLSILVAAVAQRPWRAPTDQRCVRRAKALLNDDREGRISLARLAAEAGVSPAHLMQCFKASEGMPLYQYHSRLRIGRALGRLAECEDITDLALELGFSSHSHFTAAFRSRTGMTPSAYRALGRTARAA